MNGALARWLPQRSPAAMGVLTRLDTSRSQSGRSYGTGSSMKVRSYGASASASRIALGTLSRP
jgi:hypothetical protein